MKFIADAMLGRLARWLRLIGYDTLYYPHIEDSLLLRIAKEEDRLLLTRDTRLVKVRGLTNFLLLKENDTFEQLKKVIEHIGHPGTHPLPIIYSRCSLCNTLLEDVPKEQAREQVPEYVYLTSDRFKHCPECGKFYWKGTHPEKLRKKLREILPGLSRTAGNGP